MNFQEFQLNIKHALELKLGHNFTISLQGITKNNHTHFDGLTIAEEGLNISPTIYLNSFYEQYLSGTSLEEIYAKILTVYYEHKPTQNIDVSFFTNYEEARKKIFYKLIHFEKNKELLESVPHFSYLDFAIVFCCFVDTAEHGIATILIQNHHLNYWSVTKDELYEAAKINTPQLLPAELRSMTSVIQELLCETELSFPEERFLSKQPQMYVLSNSTKLYGASCILYPDLLREFANRLQSDFYVLPSSIHEVILVTNVPHTSISELSGMVKEINSTQLSEEEILSDHAYYFSKDENKLIL